MDNEVCNLYNIGKRYDLSPAENIKREKYFGNTRPWPIYFCTSMRCFQILRLLFLESYDIGIGIGSNIF